MTYEDFIKGIRVKYPEYEGISDTLLVKSVLEKYPTYVDFVEQPIPYNFNQQFFPSEMPKVDFPEPEEGQKEESTFWSEFKRSGHSAAVRITGDVGGAVANILGTTTEGVKDTYTGYIPGDRPFRHSAAYLQPLKEKAEEVQDFFYVSEEKAKKLTEENIVFQAGDRIRDWSKSYIETHPELQDPENMEQLSWGNFYKPEVLGRIIGDGAVSMTASIGSGMLGTVVGGPILGMASAMTAGGIIEGASAYSTVKEYGNLSYEDQAKVSSLVGMAAGLISALPAFNIIGKMGLQKPF